MTNLTIENGVKKSADKKELGDLPPLVGDEEKVKDEKTKSMSCKIKNTRAS